MYWDGTRWTDERPVAAPLPARRQRRQRRLVDWIATLPILVLVPLLFSPFLSTTATAPRLLVTGVVAPSSLIGVTGIDLPPRTVVQLTWDGSAAGMPSARTSPRGTLGVTVRVPSNASASNHEIAATSGTRSTGGGKARKAPDSAVESPAVTTFATVVVTVVEAAPDPEPTGTPKPDPTADPTKPPLAGTPRPDPTADPTKPPPTATPEPDPTATPKPDPTPTPKPDPTSTPTPDPGPVLTFAAECNGGSIDNGVRALYVAGDPGFGLDSDFMGDLRMVDVGNGHCTITAERRSTPSGRAYASACLSTKGSFSQRYGIFEARIRYPKGAGVWPAFWMLRAGSVSTPPEIDIFEAYPAPVSVGGSGSNVLVTSNHYDGGVSWFATDRGFDWSDAYHVHRMVWTADKMVFSIDGVTTGTISSHIPDDQMYVVLNLALGAPGFRVDGSTPDVLKMDIDYIRVWQR